MPPASSRRCWVSATGWSGHVTRDRRPLTGPLGRRLLAAFVLVALSSVAVLTVAALIGTDRGLTSAHRSERQQAAGRVAAAAGTAYTDANGWAGADLSTASAIADAAGARLVVRDTAGSTVWPGRGMGPGMGGMHPDGGGVVDAPVVVGGQRVGTVRLSFATAATGGRTVAWSWVIGAALVALAAALAVSGYVAHRLTRPLVALAAAARRFAAGDRAARARLDAPGELGELGEVAHAFDTMADEVVRAETVRRPRPPTWPTSYVPRSPRCRPAWRNYATACANPTRGWPPCTTRRYGSAAWWPTWPTCPPPSPPPCRCARRTPTSPRSPGRRWPPSAHSWTRRACASTPT